VDGRWLVSRDESKVRDLVASLFMDHYARLAGYAARRLGSVQDAEEVVQEAFMQLFLALLGGERVANPRGWLVCTVRRRVIDHYRYLQRWHDVAERIFAECAEAAVVMPACGTGDEGELARLLAPLSAREEEVLRLRAEGLKYREIGKELSITGNSVKTLLARGVRKIRDAASSGGGLGERKEARAHEPLQ
jgi:RNA polymerase sigma-70 factor, ECF subfamily